MGKTYRRDSDRLFKDKRSKIGKKPKKWKTDNLPKKKSVRDFLEEENDS